MTNSRPDHPEISKVIDQRYEILRQLREEPWGAVWLAQDKILGVEVGLKLLTREAARWTEAQQFFQQEAILSLRLRHPQILGVFHLGKTERSLYLVQEPFPGESLMAHLARHHRFTLPQALDLLEQVTRALVLAHGQGLAHQALNPLQILLEDGEVRVANFAFPPEDYDQAMYLELKAYNPPEVLQGEAVSLAGNVFSLGVLGFRLAAGSLPYPLTFDEPFPYRLESPPVDLGEIPISLQNVLLQCLAVEPEERLPDAASLLGPLQQLREQWRSGRPERWGGWEPARRWASWQPAGPAGDFLGRLWAGTKSGAGKIRDLIQTRGFSFRPSLGRLWWGLGLAVLLLVLVMVGNKMRRREAPPPALPVKAAPVKLPAAKGAPPLMETGEPAPPPGPAPAVTPEVSQPPPLAPPAPEEAKPPPKEERYLIVAATFAKEDQATKLKQRLKTRNYSAKVVKKTTGKKTVYQVQVGPVTGAKPAEEMARRLKTQEHLTPKVQKMAARPANSSAPRKQAK